MAYFGKIQFSTTNMIPGYEIIEHKGIVFERVVSGVGLISEFFAGLSDVFGGRSGRMEEQLDALYTELFSAMANKAEKIEANAIIGFSIDVDEISGKGTSMLMISGTGTAVTVRPIENRVESNAAKTRKAPWTCVKCRMVNSWQANFCPHCGEKRHFKWKCQNCSADNLAEFNFCPSCGKQRTLDEEKEIDCSQSTSHDFNLNDLAEALQGMKNASEIHAYLKKTYADDADSDMEYFLSCIEDIVRFERIYGYGKNDAIKIAKGFFEHNCMTYYVDKKKDSVECPCCGTSLKDAGMSCPSCGALFRYPSD